jgi:hypothetical protein
LANQLLKLQRIMTPKPMITHSAARAGTTGFAFTELLVIVGTTVVLLIGVAGFALFSGRSFAAIFN